VSLLPCRPARPAAPAADPDQDDDEDSYGLESADDDDAADDQPEAKVELRAAPQGEAKAAEAAVEALRQHKQQQAEKEQPEVKQEQQQGQAAASAQDEGEAAAAGEQLLGCTGRHVVLVLAGQQPAGARLLPGLRAASLALTCPAPARCWQHSWPQPGPAQPPTPGPVAPLPPLIPCAGEPQPQEQQQPQEQPQSQQQLYREPTLAPMHHLMHPMVHPMHQLHMAQMHDLHSGQQPPMAFPYHTPFPGFPGFAPHMHHPAIPHHMMAHMQAAAHQQQQQAEAEAEAQQGGGAEGAASPAAAQGEEQQQQRSSRQQGPADAGDEAALQAVSAALQGELAGSGSKRLREEVDEGAAAGAGGAGAAAWLQRSRLSAFPVLERRAAL
jgi:hypothetical protein